MTFSDKDGIIQVNDRTELTILKNVERYRNQFSPFSSLKDITINPESLFVDTYYGNVYNSWRGDAEAIYGKTYALPEYSGDSLANYGFLRIPFRRIPRIFVSNRKDLEKIISAIQPRDPDLRLLFRGQNREHLLGRSPEILRILYGDSEALEPSLLPSSLRRGAYLDDIYPQWCSLVQLFMTSQRNDLATSLSNERFKEIERFHAQFRCTFNFRMFALALAQHYGLPSNGLDVTDNLNVALFFALTEYTKSSEEKVDLCRHKTSPYDAVIYVFTPRSRYQLDYEDCKSIGLCTPRPDAQSAHFLHTAWGHSLNNCAKSLFLAIYLDPLGNFGPIPKTHDLFPFNDPFGKYLDHKLQLPLPNLVRSFIEQFRWVRD